MISRLLKVIKPFLHWGNLFRLPVYKSRSMLSSSSSRLGMARRGRAVRNQLILIIIGPIIIVIIRLIVATDIRFLIVTVTKPLIVIADVLSIVKVIAIVRVLRVRDGADCRGNFVWETNRSYTSKSERKINPAAGRRSVWGSIGSSSWLRKVRRRNRIYERTVYENAFLCFLNVYVWKRQ